MSADKKVTPTQEQVRCIDEFNTRKGLRINAYAGAGKTSTLVLCAKSTSRHGTYVAFNKSIAADAAKKFPENVTCSTVHSLAYRALVRRYGKELDGKKLTGSMNGGYVAAKMGLGTEELSQFVRIPGRSWGRLLLDTVGRFCLSGRPALSETDVPVEGALAQLDPKEVDQLRQRVVADARRMWERMADPKGDMYLGHDGYLKVWALREPTLAGDYVFADEAQDTNGVVLKLIQSQPGQVVAVGDRYQSIYEWRGAINAMDRLPTELESRLTQSFRFGPAVAVFANEMLLMLGETDPLRGNPTLNTTIGRIDTPDITLCRKNLTVLERVMMAIEDGRKPHIIGGVKQLLSWLTATELLMAGQRVDYPMEFFGFRNWDDVLHVAEQGEAKELELWVQIVGKYKPAVLRKALESLPQDESDADILLSTAHKAKGREWGRVTLASDFLASCERDIDPAAIAAELRLLYVAATRAIDRLYVPDSIFSTLQTIRERQQSKVAA